MKKPIQFTVLILIIIGCIYGYFANAYKFFAVCDFEAPYKCEVVRGLTIVPFAPFGVITGYMDLGE